MEIYLNSNILIEIIEKCLNLIQSILTLLKSKIMGIKPGPKRIAKTTGDPDRRQRDNKESLGNTPSLKPHKHKKGD